MNDTCSVIAQGFAPGIVALVARLAEQQSVLFAPLRRRFAGRPGEIEAVLALACELLYEDEIGQDGGWPRTP